MKLLKDVKDLKGKKVFLRTSLNVPVENGKIADDFRIESSKKTIQYLLDSGAKVALVSHINNVDTFKNIHDQVAAAIGIDFKFVEKSDSSHLDNNQVVLFDNIRRDKREKENNSAFAKEMSKGFDLYVNDDFPVSHRKHASIDAITNFLPSYGGFQLEREVEELSKAFDKSLKPKVVVIGGAKIGTKSDVIKNFLNLADHILIGGALANNFLLLQHIEEGASLVDKEALDMIRDIDLKNPKLLIPEDVVITDDISGKGSHNIYPVRDIDKYHAIVDIGPETIKHFKEAMDDAKLIVWNGPMGLYEVDAFADGSKEVAKAIASSKAYSIVGGGDTLAFLEEFGFMDKYDFVSTGGGAMLEFLAGKKLPGLEALK